MRWQRDETVVLNREIRKQDVIGNVHEVGPEERRPGGHRAQSARAGKLRAEWSFGRTWVGSPSRGCDVGVKATWLIDL